MKRSTVETKVKGPSITPERVRKLRKDIVFAEKELAISKGLCKVVLSHSTNSKFDPVLHSIRALEDLEIVERRIAAWKEAEGEEKGEAKIEEEKKEKYRDQQIENEDDDDDEDDDDEDDDEEDEDDDEE